MFASWPVYVFKEPSQRKQLSIMFKHNFRAAAPAPGAAPQSTPSPGKAEPLGLCQHKHLLAIL